MMFEYLLESNNLKAVFERYGLSDMDIKFIEEQIAGPLESEMCSQLASVSLSYLQLISWGCPTIHKHAYTLHVHT